MRFAYQIECMSFSYGLNPTLVIDDLRITAGEFMALRGPNGSGKTTLLHVLGFLNIPQHGNVRFFDRLCDKKNLVGFRRRVGLLLQHPYLFNTSVLVNVITGLRLRGVKKTRAIALAKDALSLVGLSGLGERFALTLSGGEAQRVALARTLVLDPEVLLLDEPSSHMDPEGAEITKKIVSDLNKRSGKTVVMATHDDSSDLCHVDRVCVLERGRISHSDYGMSSFLNSGGEQSVVTIDRHKIL